MVEQGFALRSINSASTVVDALAGGLAVSRLGRTGHLQHDEGDNPGEEGQPGHRTKP